MPDHPPSASPSRRTLLVGGGLVAAGALAGVGAGLARHESDSAAPPDPAVLLAAVHAEQVLIASVDAALRGRSAPAAVLQQLRADHVAHLAALRASVAVATGAAVDGGSASSTPPVPVPTGAPSAARLRSAETTAGAAAARRALALTGRDAVLLASIAACERTHAELFA